MTQLTPKVESAHFVAKLATLLLFTTLGVALLALGGLGPSAAGVLIIGAMFAHAVELQHPCLHYTALSSRRANRIAGIILGLPTLTSFHAYRRSHLEHHRNLGTESDTPFFTYRFLKQRSLGAFLLDLFGVSHVRSSLSAIFGNAEPRLISLPTADEAFTNSERFDYAIMAFFLACFVLCSFGFGSLFLAKVWLLPFLFVAQPIHFLIELPEHIGCAHDTTDAFRNTRTIIGSRFSRWFTNSNNFHVEHHLVPSLSMDQLSLLNIEQSGQHKFLNRTYFQFYLSLFKLDRSAFLPVAIDDSVRRPA